jgi:hypothetical protein
MAAQNQNDEPYELLSVDKSDPPAGGQGDDWCRYQIAQGSNVITGYRQGSVNSTKRAAEEIVTGLNERRSPKRGRVQLTQLNKTTKAKTS